MKFCATNAKNLNKKVANTENILGSRSIEFAPISETGIIGLPPDMQDFTYSRADDDRTQQGFSDVYQKRIHSHNIESPRRR